MEKEEEKKNMQMNIIHLEMNKKRLKEKEKKMTDGLKRIKKRNLLRKKRERKVKSGNEGN